MIPNYLHTLVQDSSIAVPIVADNAKGHYSTHQRPQTHDLPVLRKKRRLPVSRSQRSRWESEGIHLKKNSDESLKLRDPMEGTSLQSVLSKPVRRRSIDDPDLLAILHDSISSIEDVFTDKKQTASILANALENISFYRDEYSTTVRTDHVKEFETNES